MTEPEGIAAILPLIERFIGNQPDGLEGIRTQIKTELEYAERTVQRTREQLAAIEWVMANVDREAATNGAPPTAARLPGAPSLRKAIKLLLTERSDYWTRDEIISELERRGWAPGGKTPRNTVISRLSEMTRAGVIERGGKGQYRLATAPTEMGGQQSLR